MQRHLFLVTLGPVQEFIASARRSRDLWFGSWLLSELSRAGAEVLLQPTFDSQLIFPAPSSDDPSRLTAYNVANRILAEVPQGVDCEVLGKAVAEGVQARLAALREAAFANISWHADHPNLRTLALRQVEDLIEVTWVALPLTDDYKASRNRIEDVMAARKATRTFGAAPQLSGVHQPKSSIDGSRESVIPQALSRAAKANVEGRRLLYRSYRADYAEQLSGVDLLKRWGAVEAQEADFPSTSHFAALPFLDRETVGDQAVSTAFARYLEGLRAAGAQLHTLDRRFQRPLTGEVDAAILFEDRLALELGQADVATAHGHLLDFFVAATNNRRPDPYYALLLADGDNMGLAIDMQNSPEAHRMVSRTLDGFAARVREVVEQEYSGALIYAGGDDVLAFLPMHTVLGCAQALAAAFQQQMAAVGLGAKTPTLSVGVALVHHLEPLADALTLARRAERLAKELPGKDALGLILNKRSGAECAIRGRWAGGIFLRRLKRWIEWYRRGRIPDGVAYELRDVHMRLTSLGQCDEHALTEHVLAEEALRILKRKRVRSEDEMRELDPSTLAFVRAQLGLPPELPDGPPPLPAADCISVATLALELMVAREFAQVMGPLAEQEGAD
ncbi:type III-B CRISPR-associated protein Cas10/Cmr2 [Candidatus Viridilinea mediisalina]|uniref:Type III-B CRISPR-associated protein Cas10/Cmr2 n=1 Tax=Candidatus Viridilinea mediisalina TaxID=2024553 RepID=A0A2A6RP87_9CHLR|nr:type III-B CRISPR-associated protein Cas10/Cmr2 [Candidatus Viridilinea mediisalina]PDW04679.1 type III-B CRISPR-associated protein Cas10/Cmr2 [Candidatus Viridilinea mediisalina]